MIPGDSRVCEKIALEEQNKWYRQKAVSQGWRDMEHIDLVSAFFAWLDGKQLYIEKEK